MTKLFLSSFLFLFLFSVSSYASERYDGPIIDMHLHAYDDQTYWGPIPHFRTGKKSPPSAAEFESEMIRTLENNRVVLGMLSSTSVELSNHWDDKYPGRFLKGLNFNDPSNELSEKVFEEHIQKGNIEVVGEVMAQYHGLTASDEKFHPYWKIAEQHGVPVGIHTGEGPSGIVYRSTPKFRVKLGDPLLLEDMLVEFPKLKVYVMHAGGFFYPRMLQLMQMYPQVYVEVGVLGHAPQHRDMETMKKFIQGAKTMGYLDRVMFGSDQMVWPEAITDSINFVQEMDFLTVEEKQMIFYDNAARFLKLDQETIKKHKAQFQ